MTTRSASTAGALLRRIEPGVSPPRGAGRVLKAQALAHGLASVAEAARLKAEIAHLEACLELAGRNADERLEQAAAEIERRVEDAFAERVATLAADWVRLRADLMASARPVLVSVASVALERLALDVGGVSRVTSAIEAALREHGDLAPPPLRVSPSVLAGVSAAYPDTKVSADPTLHDDEAVIVFPASQVRVGFRAGIERVARALAEALRKHEPEAATGVARDDRLHP